MGDVNFAPLPIRFVVASPAGADPQGQALLAGHRRLTGHMLKELTPDHETHRAQVRSVKVGWNGAGPVWEFTCPACGIRWRSE